MCLLSFVCSKSGTRESFCKGILLHSNGEDPNVICNAQIARTTDVLAVLCVSSERREHFFFFFF